LAFDKILSGNHDISCMSCHLPTFGTGDGRSLSIGQGATGLGPARVHPKGEFIPRNAPAALNLAAVGPLFWDGRVVVDERGHFVTPAKQRVTPEMTRVFEFGLSALPLFPVLSREEMRAFTGNELARVSDSRPAGVASPDGPARTDSRVPPDVRGRVSVDALCRDELRPCKQRDRGLPDRQAGVQRFGVGPLPRGRRCGNDRRAAPRSEELHERPLLDCHNGPTLTDNRFHNVAVAQFGPGKGDGASRRDDFGR
jgi:cytochrome c peroxidase